MTRTSTSKPQEVWAVLPIKGLGHVKSRLGDLLSAREREGLVAAMAEDVVTALKATRGLARIAVITHDPDVAKWASDRDLTLINDQTASGLSEAVALAAKVVKDEGATAMLSVLADTPLATSKEFEAMLSASAEKKSRPHMILAPCREHDGSNALLIAPPDGLAFHYGPGSFKAHLGEAQRSGIVTTTLDLPGIAHDIDRVEDLAALVSTTGPAGTRTRTRSFLTEHAIAGRLKDKE